MKKRRHRRLPVLPAPRFSGRLLVTLAPQQVGMFRFLLESHENLAAFTVLDRHAALLKVFYSPHQEQAVLRALSGIGESMPLRLAPWPLEQAQQRV